VALDQATALFWDQGYAPTSLDDLSAATGMNRPSLYGAFGDKKALYLTVLERYRDRGAAAIDEVFSRDETVREAFARLYRRAIDLYLGGEKGARGCLMIGTATTEAVVDPDMRTLLGEALRGYEQQFEARLRRAQAMSEVSGSSDPAALAKLASAILHSLAIRARAGEPRADLEAVAAIGVAAICGTELPAATATACPRE
jgi:AcrR family transcriptional regulator